MSAPAIAGERVCPTCGHQLGGIRTGTVLDIDEFGDRAAPTLNHLFHEDPVMEPCPNCGSRIQGVAFVLVRDTAEGFACGYLPGVQGRIGVEGVDQDIVWSDDLETFRTTLTTHLSAVIGRIVATMTDAVNASTTADLSKTQLALASMYAPLIPGVQETMDAFTASHAAAVALTAMQRPTDVVAALDEAIALAAMSAGVEEHLRSLALAHDAPPAHGLVAALILAWVADRRGGTLDQELMGTWMMRLLNSLELWERHPEDRRPIIDADFLRRTLPEQRVWAGLVAGLSDKQRAARLVGVAARAGLLQTTDPMRMLRFEGSPAQRRARIVAIAETLEPDHPIDAIDLLSANHLFDEAHALIRRRLIHVARTSMGARITARGMRMYSDVAQPKRAYELLSLFRELRQGLDDANLEPDDAILLAREEGVALRLLGSPIGALEAYKRAEELLPQLDDPEYAESRLRRHMAIACRDIGLVPIAKSYARQAIDAAKTPDVRAENLETLASCLVRDGEFEDAVVVLEEATALADAMVHSNPETTAGIILQLAQAQALLGRDADGLASAARAYDIAVDVGVENLQAAFVMAGAGTLRAMLAQRLGRDDAQALLDEVAPIVEEALTRAEAAPGWATTSQFVRAQLLAVRGDTKALKSAVDEAAGIDLRSLLVETYMRAGRYSGARAALMGAWEHALQIVNLQTSGQSDPVGALRYAHDLQSATAELTLRDLETGAITALDALAGAELQSSIVASLNAWPWGSRDEAVKLLQDPGALLASMGDDVLVVAALNGSKDGVLMFAGPAGPGVLTSLGVEQLRALRAELSAVTSRGGPRSSPLEKSPRWRRLAAQIGAALEPRLDGVNRVALATATTLAGLPLHVVPVRGKPLCQRLPCIYTPGLLTLSRMQRFPRDEALRSVGVVSVARARDLDAAAEAFASGAERARASAGAARLEVEMLTGTTATPDAVRDLLVQVDVAYLSCHGLSQPGRGSHALLLAADGAFPPSLVGAAETASGRRHLLEWDTVGTPAPSVVLSAACSSGSATVSSSGERLGLDRAFLRAGTRLFLGPAWDVSIEDAQTLAGALLREGLSARSDWGEAWCSVLAATRGSVSESAWAAFAPIGTWQP